MTNFLVMGGAGFVGRQFIHTALWSSLGNRVAIMSRGELEQNNAKFAFNHCADRMSYYIGDIKDIDSIRKYIHFSNADCVVVTSALKRIEVCEENPAEAVLINCIGIENACKASVESGIVKSFLYTSTDKAANPEGVYGYTKAVSESIVKTYAKKFPHIKFATTRFANVLNSTGSVIPIFKDLVKRGIGPTLRSADMTRFFITPEDSSIIMWDALFGLPDSFYKSGNILIPKCRSFKVLDLAEIMAESQKLCCEIKITKPLPYEKIHEILIAKNSLLFKKAESPEYYVLDTDSKVPTEEEEMYSNDPRVLVSKEEFKEILIRVGCL